MSDVAGLPFMINAHDSNDFASTGIIESEYSVNYLT